MKNLSTSQWIAQQREFCKLYSIIYTLNEIARRNHPLERLCCLMCLNWTECLWHLNFTLNEGTQCTQERKCSHQEAGPFRCGINNSKWHTATLTIAREIFIFTKWDLLLSNRYDLILQQKQARQKVIRQAEMLRFAVQLSTPAQIDLHIFQKASILKLWECKYQQNEKGCNYPVIHNPTDLDI